MLHRSPPVSSQLARSNCRAPVKARQIARSYVLHSNTPEQDVANLNDGKDPQEQLSEDTSTQVSDLVDTDRTGELLLWIFESMFKRDNKNGLQDQVPEGAQKDPNAVLQQHDETGAEQTEVAFLGAGCYWTLDAVYRHVKGVRSVTVGFAGGTTCQPSYKQVCRGETGHAELVRIEFQPSLVSYSDLLAILETKIALDHSTKAGDPAYYKPQYRPIVLCANDAQRQDADMLAQKLRQQQPVLTMEVHYIDDCRPFWPSMTRHQNFCETNPTSSYCLSEVLPMLRNLKKHFPEKFCLEN